MDVPPPFRPLPEPGALPAGAVGAARVEALSGLVDAIDALLARGPIPTPSGLEHLSLLHLAKAAGTARSALTLLEAARWTDACILVRAVFEQLFAYLWVVQDPERAETRATMVTIKQEWANAKYLEGLAPRATPAASEALLAEAALYREVAEKLLAELAQRLGTTEKKVRDEATLRVSAKAVEVNLGPAYSIPYAHYSGFVHSDGNALANYGEATPAGMRYDPRGAALSLPVVADLHRALLRMAREVRARCGRLDWPGVDAYLAAHADWLAAADAREHQSPSDAR